MKVIGFDSWTGGSHHYERLVGAFNSKGIDLLLVHIGSWGGDINRPAQETIGDLRVRDISFYGNKTFLEIIDEEKPDVVIFLSTDTFAHRAFNRYCAIRQIPTIHLYHGLIRVQDVGNNKPHRINVTSQFKFVTSRLSKAIRKVWPAYITALWKTQASPDEWLRFVSDVIKLTLGKYIPISSKDARTCICCVYTETDIEHAEKKYDFNRENIAVVGNPDLIRFGLESEQIATGIQQSTEKRTDVIYIDTGLIYAGVTFKNANDFLNHLIMTKKSLAEQGKRLIVKLHPDHIRTTFPDVLANANIEVCSNNNFIHNLQQCCSAIVEPSTAAIIPALIGIPILLARYGKLDGQQYGEVLMNYPRARLLTNIDDVNSVLIQEKKDLDKDRVRKWISQNSGPLPAELMPVRVTKIVESFMLVKQ